MFVENNYLDKKIMEREAWWEKACIESGIWHQKLKTRVKTGFVNKGILFEETLKFKQAILLCYGKQKTLKLWQKVPKAHV